MRSGRKVGDQLNPIVRIVQVAGPASPAELALVDAELGRKGDELLLEPLRQDVAIHPTGWDVEHLGLEMVLKPDTFAMQTGNGLDEGPERDAVEADAAPGVGVTPLIGATDDDVEVRADHATMRIPQGENHEVVGELGVREALRRNRVVTDPLTQPTLVPPWSAFGFHDSALEPAVQSSRAALR